MDRRTARVGFTVKHNHREGSGAAECTLSELVFVHGGPKAVLAWIDVGGLRTPIWVDLDPAKLVAIGDAARGQYVYRGTTVDPRTDLVHADD